MRQEQHQKMFAEMQKAFILSLCVKSKALQTQKSSKPQTMELSVPWSCGSVLDDAFLLKRREAANEKMEET